MVLGCDTAAVVKAEGLSKSWKVEKSRFKSNFSTTLDFQTDFRVTRDKFVSFKIAPNGETKLKRPFPLKAQN